MNVGKMTRKELEATPHRKNWSESVEFEAMIILPGKARDLHVSGYRCMDFVAVKDHEPLCLLAGGSDVIHFDGIGGFGLNWLEKYGTCPKVTPPSAWSIDCLPKSGLLRVFPASRKGMTCGGALSSFEIYVSEASV